MKKLILPFLLTVLLSFCQFFIKQDTVLLFDTTNKAELIDTYSLFEYMQENNIESYYILDKEQPQFAEIYNKYKDNIIAMNMDNTINLNLKLFVKLIKTKYFLSGFGEENRNLTLKYILNNNKNIEHIFVPHGIILFKPTGSSHYNQNVFNKIIVVSDYTKGLWKKYGKFEENNIIKAGLPRWDNLKKIEKQNKSIFVFFTWRDTFRTNYYEHSQYYKNIVSLLNNKKLNELLEKNNITLYYGLHHHNHFFNNQFELKHNKHINIVDIDKISKYIKECDLLITDFSSISFDFMFLDKPVIFYLLDFNDYLNKIDFKNLQQASQQLDLIFNKVFTEEDVIKLVEYYINNDFKLEESKVKISNQFFYQKKDIKKTIVEKLGLESNE